MNVTEEIAALRKWLQEDETRLQSVSDHNDQNAASGDGGSRERDFVGFTQHSNWNKQPGFSAWTDWKK